MLCCSAPFVALLRRNLLYRKRNIISTILEIALPVCFAAILVWIKSTLGGDDAETLQSEIEPAVIYNDADAILTLSFSDYVTAILAERKCQGSNSTSWTISGLPNQGINWQVPFVKCDSRQCQEDGQDAYAFCNYPVLAVGPMEAEDAAGMSRAKEFKAYVDGRYPELSDTNMTHFANPTYEFVKLFDSDDAINGNVAASDYGDIGLEEIGLAVTFDGADPLDFKYSLRVNSTNFNSPQSGARPGAHSTPDTGKNLASYAKQDNVCSPTDGPSQGEFGSSCTGQYMYNGFLSTQRLVHDWIMVASGSKDAGGFVAEYGVRYVQFPERAYEEDGDIADLAAFMPLLMTLGILYSCASMISYVTQEKELRQKELLKMMGVTDLEIGLSWFLSFWCLHLFTGFFVTLISANLFENSSFLLLFVFWELCFLGFVVLSLLVATLASKATRAVLIGLLFVFGGFFLTLAVDIETGSAGTITLLSLHPVTAMSYALLEVGRLENLGIGLNGDTMTSTDAPSGYTFASAYGNLILSNLFMGLFTWYLNRVIAPDYGQAQPIYFPFSRAYWLPHSTLDTESTEVDRASIDENVPIEPVTDNLKQQVKDGEAIEIKNLRKDFGEKVAVDGLDLTMYKGQISCLLGHNGAGKTTTISMLTGALSPSGGTALIAGKDIRTDMSAIRGDIGICLQHDCLFPKLTVREHVQFFSRVKGIYSKMSYEEAEASIDQTIQDVALGEKTNTFSANLSGGMKRKLSVAMAFCGGSKVVFLDEPTSGMDPFSRRFSWNVIRQYRQDRCIVLTTHFMDEADILGDRIAIMAEGTLRCCGSPLFLKKKYGVGYQLTIEKRSNFKSEATAEGDDAPTISAGANEEHLKDIVMGAVTEAALLSNVGTEISFQLPLSASDKFVPMFEQLDDETKKGNVKSYGVSITTLDEVFQIINRSAPKEDFESSRLSSKHLTTQANDADDTDRSVQSKMDLGNEGLFGTHVKAMMKKRALNFKRDKKAWCCTTVTPSICVLTGLLLLKFVVPARNLSPMPLNLDAYNKDVDSSIQNPISYNSPGSSFTCNPGRCTFDLSNTKLAENENYSFCGGQALQNISSSCSISNSEKVLTMLPSTGIGGVMKNITESSIFVLDQSANVFEASQYGGIFFNYELNSTTKTGEAYADTVSESCANNSEGYLGNSQCGLYGSGSGYTVAYNFTALHAAPIFQMLADQSIIRDALGLTSFQISATNAPLPITSREEGYGESSDAFTLWFLIVLSFPFILGAFATFIVVERESKAKHLQTVAGVSPTAYWLATLLWDIINYAIPATITVILVFAFDVAAITTTERNMLGGFIVIICLFGPAAAAFTYCVSFMFKNPSLCNVILIVSGFLISMGASMTCFILRLIGESPYDYNEKLVRAAQIVEWIFRFFPPFCLGKGLLFAFNITSFESLLGKKLNVFDPEIMGTELIFLALESILYLGAAIGIDILSSNPEVMAFFQKTFCCQSSSENSVVASTADDDDVIAEQNRIASGEANDDAIVMSELTKVYPNGKIAVNKLSLGIAPGECFGLLGINGAGKTTTMGMLTAEFPPSAGDATLAGFSLCQEPQKTRRRIGYCPQFDAHFQNMTGREHCELYAAIKGIPADSIKASAASKLAQVGLSDEDSDRLSSKYSGGMRRRLSLACATMGQPQLVFLDECSTGVDPVARREIWQMVSDLVAAEVEGAPKTSVILTTHSMDECEALCPRIGIMASGRLCCLGSAQHLKSKFGKGFQLELKVAATVKDDDDFKTNLVLLARAKGGVSDVEEVSPDAEIFFNVNEAQAALQTVTNNEYLSSMLNAANPTGFGVYKDASSATGVLLSELTLFATNEIRMRDLGSFVGGAYPTAALRERQDMKARFEVGSENVTISQIFGSIEENKVQLRLTDYGVSQTSLEQVFNQHAAEAEKLKQGRIDG